MQKTFINKIVYLKQKKNLINNLKKNTEFLKRKLLLKTKINATGGRFAKFTYIFCVGTNYSKY